MSPRERFDRLDALRGVAIIWMAVYHFFSLNHFRFIQQNFYTDPFWTRQRMFDRFFRADEVRARAGESHGLRLAILKAIACMHGFPKTSRRDSP